MFLNKNVTDFQNWFFRIFSPEAACEVIEAEMNSHVFFEAEPDIWMVMVSIYVFWNIFNACYRIP